MMGARDPDFVLGCDLSVAIFAEAAGGSTRVGGRACSEVPDLDFARNLGEGLILRSLYGEGERSVSALVAGDDHAEAALGDTGHVLGFHGDLDVLALEVANLIGDALAVPNCVAAEYRYLIRGGRRRGTLGWGRWRGAPGWGRRRGTPGCGRRTRWVFGAAGLVRGFTAVRRWRFTMDLRVETQAPQDRVEQLGKLGRDLTRRSPGSLIRRGRLHA